MSSDPDWWARLLGAAGTVLGLGNLYFNQHGALWKRRYAAMQPLEDALNELAVSVKGRQDPQVVQSLFTAPSGAALEELRDQIEKVPDRRFRSRLGEFVDAVQAVRAVQTDRMAAGKPGLAPAQQKKLEVAGTLLDKLRDRAHKAARKGVA